MSSGWQIIFKQSVRIFCFSHTNDGLRPGFYVQGCEYGGVAIFIMSHSNTWIRIDWLWKITIERSPLITIERSRICFSTSVSNSVAGCGRVSELCLATFSEEHRQLEEASCSIVVDSERRRLKIVSQTPFDAPLEGELLANARVSETIEKRILDFEREGTGDGMWVWRSEEELGREF